MDTILRAESPGHFSHFLLQKFRETPSVFEKITQNTSLDYAFINTPPRKITVAEQRQVLHNLIDLYGPDWFVKNPDYFMREQTGPLIDAVSSSQNVKDAMMTIAKYVHKLAASIFIEIFETKSKLLLSFEFISPPTAPNAPPETIERLKIEQRTYAEVFALIMTPLGRSFMGPYSNEAELWLKHPEPSYSDAYAKTFLSKVKFGQDYNAFAIPNIHLDRPSPTSDPTRYAQAIMELSSEDIPANAFPQNTNTLIEKVERFLQSYPSGRPTVDDVSEAFHTSRRSLTRKLNLAGTSFRDLSDTALFHRSQELTQTSDLSRAAIAEKLGYNDITSYSRAIRRWRKMGLGS